MEQDIRNIKKLSASELAALINIYPWFGGARRELCDRMSKLGGDNWGIENFAEAALYVPERSKIAAIVYEGRKVDCSDKDIQSLLKKYISAPEQPQQEEKPERRPRVAGGDFFSSGDYASVKVDGDNVFSRKKEGAHAASQDGERTALPLEFCTETLAQVYADQGYYAEAKNIYSRLLLKIPEKSAYFAALIEKLEIEINNQES